MYHDEWISKTALKPNPANCTTAADSFIIDLAKLIFMEMDWCRGRFQRLEKNVIQIHNEHEFSKDWYGFMLS